MRGNIPPNDIDPDDESEYEEESPSKITEKPQTETTLRFSLMPLYPSVTI